MKIKLHLKVGIFLLLVLSFGFSYSKINYSFLTIPELVNVLPDKTTSDNPVVYSQDLSGSYNERGYYKSSSAFGDGNEIINDFNGNLMYSIPVSKSKGEGDLVYDFSLNYNGNINYNVITNDATEFPWNFGSMNIYNINAPGWVFSINGLAVQMLNFETKFLTSALNGNTAYGNDVRLLASGYNITNMMTTPTGTNKDKITIMLGDGSTETLENVWGEIDTGEYRSTSKGSYLRAKVYYGVEDQYYRIMYLMKGDGLTYIYKENYISYTDIQYNLTGLPEWKRPKAFYLTEITDRFGNNCSLIYTGIQGKYIGRLWLKEIINAGISLDYINAFELFGGLKVITSDGSFRINTSTYSADQSGDHRPVINYLINPTSEIMTFEYDSYERTATGLTHLNTGDFNISIGGNQSSRLNRISKITGFDGGIHKYRYKASPSTISLLQNEYEKPHSSINYYLGYGRDLFFTNILDTIIINDGTEDIRKTEFTYNYEYNNRTDVWQYPIDSNDLCKTTKTITSLKQDYDYETPQTNKTIKYYKIYRTRPVFTGEALDFNGTIKLIKDEYYSGTEQSYFKKTDFSYYKQKENSSNQYCDGSMLEKSIVESVNGVSKEISYAYTYDSEYGFLETKEETDPFGRKTLTEFDYFYRENFKVFENGTFYAASSNPQQYDSVYFYLIHQPKTISIIKDDDVLRKTELTYFNPETVTNPQNIVSGYPGQLNEQKDIDPANNSVLRSVSYVYFNQDTTGKHMKPNDFKNYNEGNIREFTDSKGNKTKYYYNVISRTEEEGFYCGNTDEEDCPYKVSYHILKDDGTEIIQKSSWQDYRLPTRIDGYYTQDNYITNYQLYNQIGNPLKVISANRYLTDVTYENYYRLGTITLPYDFGDTPNDTSVIINTYSSNIMVESKMTDWGGRDEINYNSNFLSNDTTTFSGVRIEHQYNLEETDNSVIAKVNMLLKFDTTKFVNISVIDSAYLEFSPYYMYAKLDNDFINDYDFYIKPLAVLNGSQSSMVYTEGVGILNAGNLTASTDKSCSKTYQEIITQYNNNYKKINVTGLLNGNIDTNSNRLKLQGLKLSMDYTGNANTGILNMEMFLRNCTGFGFYNYYNNFSPKLKIYAKYNSADTIIKINYNTGTVINTYDDANNNVKTRNKIDKSGTQNRWKETINYFDRLGKLSYSRLYTDSNEYNQTTINYNYLDLKARITDPRNNQTKLSFDKFGNNSKTQNADDSYTLVAETYYNGYTYTFGTVPGMVVKKVFTDETGNNFEKYYDAVANLRREIKYVEGIPSDNPEVELIPHVTDYKYDDLYRVIEVKTPNNKHIYYSYDGLGRQSESTTPDAGLVKYKYDKNDNLRFSQDNNQANKPTETPPSKQLSYRGYDGLNRLLYLCDSYNETYLVPWSNLNPDDTYYFDSYSYTPKNFLVINVYDTITNYPANANIFLDHKPLDYDSAARKTNNTKGSLCATAYRTLGTDSMSFKYYRYDARGRVIKMWNYIAGLGMKVTSYEYNSQNQLTKIEYQTESDTDYKRFIYTYDYAGRFSSVSTEESGPPPDYNYVFAAYKYNENSQIDSLQQNNFNVTTSYVFNNRNWITRSDNSNELFGYALEYYSNGNIDNQHLFGSYRTNFSDGKEINSKFTYDKSNRLEKIERNGNKYFDLTGDYSYDPDGNFLTLTRSYNSDNFSYDYYNGTNRLKKVSGSTDQYTYDYNGNQTNDYLNGNTSISYDHRNLITEITRSDDTTDPPTTIKIRYKYDEAGNRTRKTIYQTQDENPSPITNGDNPTGWTITKDEYYSRDASGKEIAVYQSYTLDYWNVWGTGNEGRITSDGIKYFYFKDHLGNIRAVTDEFGYLTEAQDYDPWGHIPRAWGGIMELQPYKFTGKEYDFESKYYYFGARYYNARIGRWTSTDPLFEKHIQFTSYNYVLGNPMILIDPDGKQIDFSNFVTNGGKSYMNDIIVSLTYITGFNFIFNNNQLDVVKDSKIIGGSSLAREYISNAIKDKINVYYTTGPTISVIGGEKIMFNPSQIETFIKGSHNVSGETLGHGMSLIEEIIHSKSGLGIDHTETKFGESGEIVIETNKIRKALNLGIRYSYLPLLITSDNKNIRYIPFDKEAFKLMNEIYNKPNNYDFDINTFEKFLSSTKYLKTEEEIKK